MKLNCEVESEELALALRIVDDVKDWERGGVDWKVVVVGSLRGGSVLCDRTQPKRSLTPERHQISSVLLVRPLRDQADKLDELIYGEGVI